MLTKSKSSDVSRSDGVLFVERANELVLYGWISYFRSGSAVKARLNRRTSSYGLDPKPGELFMNRVNLE